MSNDRRLSISVVTILLTSLLIPAASAQTIRCTITPFMAPHAAQGSGSSAMAVNASDTVVGFYFEHDTLHVRSFTRRSDGTITVLNAPSASSTWSYGINDAGVIVGQYSAPSGSQGFELQGGAFTYPMFPGAVFTGPQGINRNGDLVGTYQTTSSTFPGFLYAGGVYTTLDFPGSVANTTNPTGLNNQDVVVGAFLDSNFVQHGFLYANGQYQQVDVPGSSTTSVSGINDAGELVGWYTTPSNGAFQGFVYVGGQFKTLSIQSATQITIHGVNAKGHITGTYDTASGDAPAFLGTNCR